MADAGEEDERAVELARSRVVRLGSLAPRKPTLGWTSLLVRRGYRPEVARQAARRALAVDLEDPF